EAAQTHEGELQSGTRMKPYEILASPGMRVILMHHIGGVSPQIADTAESIRLEEGDGDAERRVEHAADLAEPLGLVILELLPEQIGTKPDGKRRDGYTHRALNMVPGPRFLGELTPREARPARDRNLPGTI